MKVTKKLAEFLCDLEHAFGSECRQDDNIIAEGEINYRYPVSVPSSRFGGTYTKVRTNVRFVPKMDPRNIQYAYYQMGKNELWVGIGLCKIMDLIEERYHLSFNALEDQRNHQIGEEIYFVRKEREHKRTFSYMIEKTQIEESLRGLSKGMSGVKSLKRLLENVLPAYVNLNASFMLELLGGREKYCSLLRQALQTGKTAVYLKIIAVGTYESDLHGIRQRRYAIESVQLG